MVSALVEMMERTDKMSTEMERLVNILRSAHKECKSGDCHSCETYGNGSDCVYIFLARHLIREGVVIPVLCKDCSSYDPELGICKIRYDSWGNVLERGPHDWCSDGENNKTNT